MGGLEDAHALAIRGIALAQLAEYEDARRLLSRAAQRFTAGGDPVYRARALAALAEVAAAERDLAAASVDPEDGSTLTRVRFPEGQNPCSGLEGDDRGRLFCGDHVGGHLRVVRRPS